MWAKPFPNLAFTRIPRAVVGVGEALSAVQAGFYWHSQSCGWCGRTSFCSSGWFLQKFPEVCLAWAKPLLQPRLVFTGIPRGVFGVGETLSAALAGFHWNSQRCGWCWRNPLCSPGWFLQELPKLWLAWAKPFLQLRFVVSTDFH